MFRRLIPEGFVNEYSAKKTDGTKFAEELLKKTTKKEIAPNQFVMLTPPPLPRKRHAE